VTSDQVVDWTCAEVDRLRKLLADAAAEIHMAEVQRDQARDSAKAIILDLIEESTSLGGNQRTSRTSMDILDGITAEARIYTGLQTPTSGDGGGYVVPIGFQRELEQKMKACGWPIQRVARGGWLRGPNEFKLAVLARLETWR
jgi:hypothetical protein